MMPVCLVNERTGYPPNPGRDSMPKTVGVARYHAVVKNHFTVSECTLAGPDQQLRRLAARVAGICQPCAIGRIISDRPQSPGRPAQIPFPNINRTLYTRRYLLKCSG